MGSSDSNCCGAKNGYVIPRDDPDSGTIGRKRRHHQNTDASLLKRSQSLSQDTYYGQTDAKHTFEIHGNFTISSTNSHSLPYGITLNINGLHDVNHIYMTDTNGRNINQHSHSHNNHNVAVDWNAVQWVPPPHGEPEVPEKKKRKKRQKRYIPPSPPPPAPYQREQTPPIIEHAALRPEIANYAKIATSKHPTAASAAEQEEEDESESISDLSNVDGIMDSDVHKNELHGDENVHEDEHDEHDEPDDQEVMDKVCNEKENKEEAEHFRYDLDDMQTLNLAVSTSGGSDSHSASSSCSALESHGEEDSDIDGVGKEKQEREKQGSNLLTPQQVDAWNKKEIDRHEVELLREMRRLSLTNK